MPFHVRSCSELSLQDQSRPDARPASGRAELDAGCSGSRMVHPLSCRCGGVLCLLRVFISCGRFGNLPLFFFVFSALDDQRTILFIDVFTEVHCVGLWGLHNTFPCQGTSVRAVCLDVLGELLLRKQIKAEHAFPRLLSI